MLAYLHIKKYGIWHQKPIIKTWKLTKKNYFQAHQKNWRKRRRSGLWYSEHGLWLAFCSLAAFFLMLAVCLLRACCVLTACLLHACCVPAACLLRACCVLDAYLMLTCCVLAGCLLRACCVLDAYLANQYIALIVWLEPWQGILQYWRIDTFLFQNLVNIYYK